MNSRRWMKLLLVAVLLGAAERPGSSSQGLPGPLEEVGFDQHLGESIPLDLVFRDESDEVVRLGDFFGERPVVLALVYYECPMLCPMILNGLTSALKVVEFEPGAEFEVVVVSFDARETPAMAERAKVVSLERYGRPETEHGWHFLTGDDQSIERLTDRVGFRFTFLPDTGQFAHAAGIVALTPEGRIARYFYGVEYAPRDLRLGLIEAADNKIGSVVDQVLLYCYHYDPVTGSYSAVAMNIVRLGGAVFVAIAGFLLLGLWRRERNRLPTSAKA